MGKILFSKKILTKHQNWTFREAVFATAGIAFVLLLHGAVPFYLLPGQAIWTTGFAQSFANGPLFNIYASDFGIPTPAAIAYGLAGAWPASLLIRLGLHPADAYAGMNAFWLLVAFTSAVGIGRLMGGARTFAILGGIVWMSMPIIWGHAHGYAMLSLGIGLLSFYFFASLKLFLFKDKNRQSTAQTVLLYFLAAITAVFMDGYTFVMFAVGSSILFCYLFFIFPEARTELSRRALPVHILAFLTAYILYAVYVGRSSFEAHPIETFRGFGLDISFIAIPTKGVHWLMDLVGFSMERSDKLYFGDDSVWVTTFSLPVLLVGLIAWWKVKRKVNFASGVLVLAVAGYYMALGPSLKINSTKPEALQRSHPGQQSALMASEYAVMPTGNAWIFEKLPAFNSMRASYRWSALGIFASWLLVMIWLSAKEKDDRKLAAGILLVLIGFNLPNINKRIEGYIGDRENLFQIDKDLVKDFHRSIVRGETVAFIPWGNDFMANYLAPRFGFRTYNIGGDKNLVEAQKRWPSEMFTLGGALEPGKAPYVIKMLVEGTVDAVIAPYFHMLWSPNAWPCPEEATLPIRKEGMEALRMLPGFVCPSQKKAEVRPFMHALQKSPYIEVVDSRLFATIRLRPEFAGRPNRTALLNTFLSDIHYPVHLSAGLKVNPFLLREGWYAVEPHGVWSRAFSKITLPVPKDCGANQCVVVLHFKVFGAGPQRPVTVNFDSAEPAGGWSKKMVSTSGEFNEVAVPLGGASGSREVSISIPDATSPKALVGSTDERILGIALERIDLVSK